MQRVTVKAIMLTLWAGVWLSLSGCLFEPRTPDPPSTGQDIPYLARTSPANVWDNLQTSLNFNDSFGWEENVHPDFTYIPDSEADNQFPGLFAGWDKEKELNFINSFYSTGSTNIAQLRNPDFVVPDPTGDESRWEGVIYYLRVQEAGNQSETRFRGSAIINFRLEGNFWYVYSWEDQVGESDPESGQILPTMGVLRGTFGSN